MSRGRGRPPAIEPAEVQYDITIVHGAAGKRLAAVQAGAILDVVLWWRDHTRAMDIGEGNAPRP